MMNIKPEEEKTIRKAIEALEKQVPKKPTWSGLCPKCSTQIRYELDYGGELECYCCPYCGQAIDWSSTNDD